MKKHKMPDMKEGGVNVTPLIDIVMCLIIFFMLVAKIGVARGIDKDIVLPSSNYGIRLSDLGNTISLNVHKTSVHDPAYPDDPQVTVMGENNIVKDIPLRKANKFLLAEFLDKFRESKKDTGSSVSNAKVIIRADTDLPYSKLEAVLETLSRAKLTDVAYETRSIEDAAAAPKP